MPGAELGKCFGTKELPKFVNQLNKTMDGLDGAIPASPAATGHHACLATPSGQDRALSESSINKS